MTYITLTEYKQYADITSTDATDDAALTQLIASACAMIDTLTNRTFTLRTETRRFDVPEGRTLWLDDDLYTVTSITNGDGVAVSSADYVLWPANALPAYAIRMTGDVYWTGSTTTDERVIQVAGSWGYSVSAPNDIKAAALEMVRAFAGRRSGQSQEGVARVTAGGIVITPQGVPKAAAEIIVAYRRNNLWP